MSVATPTVVRYVSGRFRCDSCGAVQGFHAVRDRDDRGFVVETCVCGWDGTFTVIEILAEMSDGRTRDVQCILGAFLDLDKPEEPYSSVDQSRCWS